MKHSISNPSNDEYRQVTVSQGRNVMAKKKMIHDFIQMKKDGDKITFLTAYDYPTAQFAEAAPEPYRW